MNELVKINDVINTKRDPKEVKRLEYKKSAPIQNEFTELADKFKAMRTGEEIDYKCKLCNDKGFVVSDSTDYFIEDTLSKVVDGAIVDIPVYLKKCKCRIAKEFEINMNRSGMGDILDTLLNEKYETKFDWQKRYRAQMESYITSDDNGFIMSGQTGSGKTLLMGKALLNFLDRGREVYYFDWFSDYKRKLVNQYNKQESDHFKLLDYMCTVDVLYIDDLFKTRGNNLEDLFKREVEIEIFRKIILKRCKVKGIKTIISMEWTPEDIKYLDNSLRSRMVEMLGDGKENWITMTDKENRNIRELKFNDEF